LPTLGQNLKVIRHAESMPEVKFVKGNSISGSKVQESYEMPSSPTILPKLQGSDASWDDVNARSDEDQDEESPFELQLRKIEAEIAKEEANEPQNLKKKCELA
jgi:hypothetical protein